MAHGGNFDEAYAVYIDLFSNPDFLTYRHEEQRQAPRLMIHTRDVPSTKTPMMVEAHRAAVSPLTKLVSAHNEPTDYEMLGICYQLLGNVERAGRIFRAGLAIERERSPQSDLCGVFMKRISLL